MSALAALDIDTRLIGDMPTQKTSHNREEGNVIYDSFGIGWTEINGHNEMIDNPLRDATEDEVMAYEFPDPENIDESLLKQWAGQAEYLQKNTD